MTATTTAPRAAPRSRRPALAIGTAFVITLAAVGTVLLVTRGGEEAPPVTTVTTTLPPTTTTLLPTTTSPATTTTEGTLSVEEWSYPAEAVPPFHATIAWDRNPESTWRIGYQGSSALVDVWYEAPLRFRWQLVELDTDLIAQGVPGAGQHMGGPGSYVVADGEAMGHYWAADEIFPTGDASEYLAFMFWEPQSPEGLFDWAGQCADESSSLTQDTVAGRASYHIACSTVRGDWELWVDTQTGLVLKLLGETEIDDRLLGTSPQGGFEVTLIEFLEAPIPGSDTLFEVVPPEGVEPPVSSPDESQVPPLHAVVTFIETFTAYPPPEELLAHPDLSLTAQQTRSRTEEIWYQDPQNWRIEILAAEGPGEYRPGEISTMADGAHTDFYPMTWHGYTNAYEADQGKYQIPSRLLPFPWESEAAWLQVGIESVAGRPAVHYEDSSSTCGTWIDIETGLVLQRRCGGDAGQTTLSIEIDPTFPQGIFTFTPEPGWCNLDDMTGCTRGTWDGTLLSEGADVPTFTRPLADGTEFDLADLRGRPTIVFNWWDVFEEGVLERLLEDFEALYLRWGDRVAFVSVAYDQDTRVRRLVERLSLTHPVVACMTDTIPEGEEDNLMCAPVEPTYIWGTAFPSWLMIDAEGRALDLRRGTDTTFEDLDAMIAAAVGD